MGTIKEIKSPNREGEEITSTSQPDWTSKVQAIVAAISLAVVLGGSIFAVYRMSLSNEIYIAELKALQASQAKVSEKTLEELQSRLRRTESEILVMQSESRTVLKAIDKLTIAIDNLNQNMQKLPFTLGQMGEKLERLERDVDKIRNK